MYSIHKLLKKLWNVFGEIKIYFIFDIFYRNGGNLMDLPIVICKYGIGPYNSKTKYFGISVWTRLKINSVPDRESNISFFKKHFQDPFKTFQDSSILVNSCQFLTILVNSCQFLSILVNSNLKGNFQDSFWPRVSMRS